MIYIGVTGWGDHPSLYDGHVRQHELLQAYSSHFPFVEVDSSFYAIQREATYEKWVRETPDIFRFVVKAYQGMTGHLRSDIPFDSKEEMFGAFKASIQPMLQAGKLKAVLFQYPPWFRCERKSVNLLRYTKQMMGDIPVAVEFRHQSWFSPAFKEQTIQFLRQLGFVYTICDEPQIGEGSVPMVLEVTNEEFCYVRMHGRNKAGWIRGNRSGEEWRKVRFLYRYNEEELREWADYVRELHKQAKDVCIVFNNNSGLDAADNAKRLIELLEIEYVGLYPKQLGLF